MLIGQTHPVLRTDLGDPIQSLLKILAVGCTQDVCECKGRYGWKVFLGLGVGAAHYYEGGGRCNGVRLYQYGRRHRGIVVLSVIASEACTASVFDAHPTQA